ncbi:acetoacetate--CoA ligase [Kribbella sp. NPDC056861]|uniref:acetoacetate--CoA ligase n=1 Tax=Kribbella sp. NPDC056861 TaxID=3154857 RepID=UPI003422E23F
MTDEVLRKPSPDWRTNSRLGAYADWLQQDTARTIEQWDDLWSWSVDDLDGFWTSIWDYFGVRSDTPRGQALVDRRMPGARWFDGARLNYARHLLEDADPERVHDDEPAIIAYSQSRDRIELTFAELRRQVAQARAGLVRLGVERGDRVAAYLPNLPETVVAFLATASLGAIWTSCAPEFGVRSVLDRFGQVEPKVLLVVSGYDYGDKRIDRRQEVAQLRDGLPTVRQVVHVGYGVHQPAPGDEVTSWAELLAGQAEPQYEVVPFDHPLFVLYSSGTTGKPKAIVHGHGGILLEHLKNHSLSWDLGPGDRLLWFSTTAWMMWNALVSALLVRSSIVLLDGNPAYPSLDLQWRLAAETRTTVMGASPPFLMACREAGLQPATTHDLSALKEICPAGSPLPTAGYHWVLREFGEQVLLNVGSGGTDVCSGIVQGSPLQPVVAGEIAGACLGVKALAFDPAGRAVTGELGELVITEPMPSMPVGFWGDDDGTRYAAAYFATYPGIWRHGDWVRFSESGSCVIAGRSDATLNRGGVRLGTAEFYAVVEELPEIDDSLVIHLEDPAGGNGELILYVVTAAGVDLDDPLRAKIVGALRQALSPRHAPDRITQVPAVPRTRTGKKLELPVKQLLQGRPLEAVVTPGSVVDEQALTAYLADANRHNG